MTNELEGALHMIREALAIHALDNGCAECEALVSVIDKITASAAISQDLETMKHNAELLNTICKKVDDDRS